MGTEAQPLFTVHIRDLPCREVVCLTCQVDQASGQFNTQIGDGFAQVTQWAKQQSEAVAELLIIGVPHVAEPRLSAYDCCVQHPNMTAPHPQGWQAKQLPAGRYAVLTLDKNSATIGERIGQFFAVYAPQHHLIDATRPSYEVYYAQTMDYCVPIQ